MYKNGESHLLNFYQNSISRRFYHPLFATPHSVRPFNISEMSEQTYHTTRDNLRKPESRVAQQHGGKTPADSDVSKMKVAIAHGN